MIRPVVRQRNGLEFFQLKTSTKGENGAIVGRVGRRTQASRRTFRGARTVILFPGHNFPAHAFVQENWAPTQDFTPGSRRAQVIHVKRLTNNQKLPAQGFFVKTTQPRAILYHLGYSNKFVDFPKRLANQAADWEARSLRRVQSRQTPVEQPLALIIHPNGTRQLVTKAVAGEREDKIDSFDSKYWDARLKLFLRAKRLKIKTDDMDELNFIRTPRGRLVNIDAGQWVNATFTKRLLGAQNEILDQMALRKARRER